MLINLSAFPLNLFPKDCIAHIQLINSTLVKCCYSVATVFVPDITITKIIKSSVCYLNLDFSYPTNLKWK